MTIDELKILLDGWLANQVETSEMVEAFRTFYKTSQLPEKYGAALEGLLERTESASLFTEESCSFSRQDLSASFQFWLEKAGAQLKA